MALSTVHDPAVTQPHSPPFEGTHGTVRTPVQHPPLGMSYFPTDSDSDHDEERPTTAGFGSSFLGSIRSRAKSMVVPGSTRQGVQSPMHPVPLTEIAIPGYNNGPHNDSGNAYYGHDPNQEDHVYGLPSGLGDHKTEYEGAGAGGERHITIAEDAHSRRTGSRGSSLHPGSAAPTPPPHSARRQFSFQNVFRKGAATAAAPASDDHDRQPQSRSPMIRKGLGARKTSAGGGAQAKGATEEERLGLVKGDTRTGRLPTALDYRDDEDDELDEDEDEDDDVGGFHAEDKLPLKAASSPELLGMGRRRDLTPPRREREREREKEMELESAARSDDDHGHDRAGEEEQYYEQQRRKWDSNNGGGGNGGRGGKGGKALPPPPPFDDGKGGAFI